MRITLFTYSHTGDRYEIQQTSPRAVTHVDKTHIMGEISVNINTSQFVDGIEDETL